MNMKVDNIVICVDASCTIQNSLTEGKQYKILLSKIKMGKYMYTIENDCGCIIEYYAHRFKTLVEIREEKLKELGL